MVTCSWGLCNSDSRYGPNGKRSREDMTNVKFYSFPKPKTNLEKCKQWIKACGRKYFTVDNITRSSYVCSKHFYEGKPTEAYPNPYPADTPKLDLKISAKRSAPKSRPCIPSKQKKITEDLESESLEIIDHVLVCIDLQLLMKVHNFWKPCVVT